MYGSLNVERSIIMHTENGRAGESQERKGGRGWGGGWRGGQG